MAKQSGLGDQLYLQGRNISGDVGALDSIACPMSPLTVTGIDKSAVERIGGLRDGNIEFTSYFNKATDAAFDRLRTLPATDVVATYCRGQSLGSPAAGIVAKQVNYDGSRGDDGSLVFKTQLTAAAYGLNWGEQLTAGVATYGGASAGTSIDGNNYGTTGTTAFGLQAFLQVFAFTGTSATVAIQASSDNAVGDPFANVTGAVFTTVTAQTAERIATGATNVERYLRVNVSGTFSLLWFSVVVCRNAAAVSF
jgi:hypothetical protein